MTPNESDALTGLSEERIHYLARIGAIFERLYKLKDLHDAEYRAIVSAGLTAKIMNDLGESNERIEEIMRACLLPDRSSWSSWELAGEENRKQSAFVDAYIQEHFGPDPDDTELAMSEALKAYHRSLGLVFGLDEESFILPDREDEGA
ncbi:hypothetical protein HQN89_33710 [Paenibacillus frigoriresistens]|uniref:hypothetical protein n=1 Tax=Paenibacillus alginolyticus TaxID=59839 RepID=UPI0015664F4C|nr:hypothetical protein [Paenibacillus frigoriresistens]NRF95786.1 hypothetical protein [Paenibacillus frigoriresistens]